MARAKTLRMRWWDSSADANGLPTTNRFRIDAMSRWLLLVPGDLDHVPVDVVRHRDDDRVASGTGAGPFSISADWLRSSCPHHLVSTNSGRMTVMMSLSCSASSSSR